MPIMENIKAAGASVRNFLAGRTPSAQLAEIEAGIAGAKGALAQLAGGTFMVIPTNAIFAERGAAEAALASNSAYRSRGP
ncbi:MAG: hypothetical protein ACREE4_15820 [Stellaceae bacterium]